MDRSSAQSPGRRVLSVLILVPALAAACAGSSSPTASPVASASPSQATVSPAATPRVAASPTIAVPSPSVAKGPAVAQFALTGTNGLTGAVTIKEIYCNQPSLSGPQIEALGSFASGPDFVLFVSANHIEARVGTGSAATLKLRTFSGSGVTSFDAAIGAELNSSLTEITDAGTAAGTLGTLSQIQGTLDCGNETAGTANIVISGNDALGAMSGALTSVDVICTVSGGVTYVGSQGLGMAGTTPVLVFVTAGPGHLQVGVESGKTGTFYGTSVAGVVTLGADGAQFAGDVSTTAKAGTPTYTLHVVGSDTCGNTVHL